jgi:hypothetical protein
MSGEDMKKRDRSEDLTGRIAKLLAVAAVVFGAASLVPEQQLAAFPILKEIQKWLGPASNWLLLVSLVVFVFYIYEKLQSLDAMMVEIRRSDVRSEQGYLAEKIARLLQPQSGEERLIHKIAGANTVHSVALESLPEIVSSFLAISSSKAAFVEEQLLVAKYLIELIRNLPDGTIWFGTSCLESPEAWNPNSINKLFALFEEECRNRIASGTMLYYRLFQFDSLDKARRMKDEMLRQQSEKRFIRYQITNEPEDMSIICIASPARLEASPAGQRPIKWSMEHLAAEALCGLQFHIEYHASFQKLYVYHHESDKFGTMASLLDEYWYRLSHPLDRLTGDGATTVALK